MSRIYKSLIAFVLCSVLVTLATPAYAFDGRSGDKVVVQAGEVINDDLYVGANEFVLDGTVNGDVISGAQGITVNGLITGNLIAAGQSVVINGSVTGDVVAAGSVLFFGEKAQVGGDIVGASYSLELRQGAKVGRDAVLGAGQIKLAGDVGRNVLAGSSALEIDGNVGGNVKAVVGEADQMMSGPPPTMFMGGSTVSIPIVHQGLTMDPAARIKGNLQYTQKADLVFPSGVVGGSITRQAPPAKTEQPARVETTGEKVGGWVLNLLRTLITLLLIGLLLVKLFPAFLRTVTDKLQSQPWPSLGLGVVAWAGALFVGLVLLLGTILGAVIFGILTLGGLSGAIVWIGIMALLALIIGFVLVTSFLAKIVFGAALGRLILSRSNPQLAEHRYWPMVIGVAITVVVVSVLSFPLIPGLLGWLMNIVVVLFGLGALWIWGRELIGKRPVAAG